MSKQDIKTIFFRINLANKQQILYRPKELTDDLNVFEIKLEHFVARVKEAKKLNTMLKLDTCELNEVTLFPQKCHYFNVPIYVNANSIVSFYVDGDEIPIADGNEEGDEEDGY